MNKPLAKVEADEALLPADPMISMIERVAMNPDLPIERLTHLMDMRERQMDKEAEQVFNQAFASAMAEMPDVPKSGKNTHSKQRYSTLDDLIRTTRPVLACHGLSLNWQTQANGNEYSVTAIVRHAMGHSIQTTLTGGRDSSKQMNALQGGGSTETYLKRYTGFSILGLSSGDEIEDDGAAANSTPLSQEQFIQLGELIDRARLKEQVILDAEKISALHMLPANRFDVVKANLLTNIKRLESK